MLENRSINLLSYNIETVLAEKLQTILVRGILNTRMRDFYDVHVLLSMRKNEIDMATLKKCFYATCKNRQSECIIANSLEIFDSIASDERLASLWELYQKKYPYAKDLNFEDIIKSLRTLIEMSVYKR